MISILIPVYNFDVGELVQNLHKQASAAGQPFEIRCYDDDSTHVDAAERLEKLKSLENVIVKHMSQNLGRSAIRNMLAQEAAYDHLLFMDCDSRVLRNHYVGLYLDQLKINPAAVIYGGRTYEKEPPSDPSRFLHWKYGWSREVMPPEARAKHPYRSFMTNNFLVPRKLMMDIGFDEDLQGYGHEDTLFGMELKQRNIRIIHFFNPLVHIGLETADDFLQKTREGLRNLHQIQKSGKDLTEEVRLLRIVAGLERFGMLPYVRQLSKHQELRINKNLRTQRVSLFWLDVYKLCVYLRLSS